MSERARLQRIARIIEAVDSRAMAADGPVTPTRQEMTDDEMREIYRLAAVAQGRATGQATAVNANEIPRRADTEQWTPAEAMIAEAMAYIEGIEASEHLTRAVVLLGEAMDAVADYVDGVPVGAGNG